jgi:hypothetical protein
MIKQGEVMVKEIFLGFFCAFIGSIFTIAIFNCHDSLDRRVFIDGENYKTIVYENGVIKNIPKSLIEKDYSNYGK